MITNGWLMNEEIADKAVEAGINTVAISVDGLEETHDFIRKKGSFQRIMRAFDILLRIGDNMQSQRCFTGPFWSVNLHNSASGNSTNTKAKSKVRAPVDIVSTCILLPVSPKRINEPFPNRFFHILDSHVQCFLFIVFDFVYQLFP